MQFENFSSVKANTRRSWPRAVRPHRSPAQRLCDPRRQDPSGEVVDHRVQAGSHVASPEAVLRMLPQPHGIDMVVSDLMMPGSVTGVQLAREIRNRQPALPIRLTTGSVAFPAGLKENEFPLLLKP